MIAYHAPDFPNLSRLHGMLPSDAVITEAEASAMTVETGAFQAFLDVETCTATIHLRETAWTARDLRSLSAAVDAFEARLTAEFWAVARLFLEYSED
jgi:hypothetical protein